MALFIKNNAKRPEDQTLLWSTTATTLADNTIIALSESIYNFERIRIEYSTLTDDMHSAIEINIDDAPLFSGNTGEPQLALGCQAQSAVYARCGYFGLQVPATSSAPARSQINWTVCKRVGATTSTPTYCVPKNIYGINRIKWPTLSNGDVSYPF